MAQGHPVRFAPSGLRLLTMSAEQRWLELRGAERITEVVQGVKFKNGVREQSQKIAA